jgi:hypothetical protein
MCIESESLTDSLLDQEGMMAKQVIENLIDDLEGGPATKTIRFGIDGTEYEIDLNDDNAEYLEKTLADHAAKGRKVTRVKTVKAGNGRANSDETATIRAWALAHGHDVKPRGRVPANLVQAYREAHGAPA